MIAYLRRLAHRLLDHPPELSDLDPDDRTCEKLAQDLAVMGEHAAPRNGEASPGTEKLLARARLLGKERFGELIAPLSQGIAASSASRLAIGAADQEIELTQTYEQRTRQRLDEHAERRPAKPGVVNRVSAHPLGRVLIAALCATVELLVTAPSLVILTHGRKLFGLIPLEDALAALLGLMTFVAAEVAAECLLTWHRGRPTGRPTLAARLVRAVRGLVARISGYRQDRPSLQLTPRRRSAGTPRATSATPEARAGLVAGVVIVVAMLGTLGWLVSVRDANVRAAKEIAASGNAPATSAAGGLPGAPAAAGGGPIAGLGGGTAAAPITFGTQPPSTPAAQAQPEGTLGPIGALSVVVFLVALVSATLAGATDDYASWARKHRALRTEHRTAEAAHLSAQRSQAAATTRVPLGSTSYDTAARHATNVVDSYLQLAAAWEGLVRQRYVVHCRLRKREPVALMFPPLPALQDEVERLLTPALPDGRQAGGFAFGTEAPAAPETETETDTEPTWPGTEPTDDPPSGVPAEPPEVDDDTPAAENPPPPEPRDADEVLDNVADLISRLRPVPDDPPARRPTRRFIPRLPRRGRTPNVEPVR